MIPDEVRHPEKYWTTINTRDEADALVARYTRDDDGPGAYTVEAKGETYAIAYSEDGAFIAYV